MDKKKHPNNDLRESSADHLAKLSRAALQGAQLAGLAAVDPHLAAIFATFGSTVATLIAEYVPSRVQQKRLNFLVEIGRRIEELEDYQKRCVTTDQFAMLFHRVTSEVGVEADENKVKAYENALISALTLDVEDALEDWYIEILRSLSPLHLEVLRAFWVDCRPKWLSYTYPGGDAVVKGKDLLGVLANRQVPLLYELIHDLAVKGLVVHLGERGDWTLPSPDPETLNCALTNSGLGLLEFITPEHPIPDYIARRRPSLSLPVERQSANLHHVTTED